MMPLFWHYGMSFVLVVVLVMILTVASYEMNRIGFLAREERRFQKAVEGANSIDDLLAHAQRKARGSVIHKMFVTAMNDYQRLLADSRLGSEDSRVDYLARPLYVLWGEEKEHCRHRLTVLLYGAAVAPLMMTGGLWLDAMFFASVAARDVWFWNGYGTVFVMLLAAFFYAVLKERLRHHDRLLCLWVQRLCIILARDVNAVAR